MPMPPSRNMLTTLKSFIAQADAHRAGFGRQMCAPALLHVRPYVRAKLDLRGEPTREAPMKDQADAVIRTVQEVRS
jgi:hypothetical protein